MCLVVIPGCRARESVSLDPRFHGDDFVEWFFNEITLEKYRWKVAELDGCEVFTTEGERLGVLRDVLPSGSNDIWVVRSEPPQEREILIPALAAVVRDVDLQRRRVTVALPAGLKEIYVTS